MTSGGGPLDRLIAQCHVSSGPSLKDPPWEWLLPVRASRSAGSTSRLSKPAGSSDAQRKVPVRRGCRTAHGRIRARASRTQPFRPPAPRRAVTLLRTHGAPTTAGSQTQSHGPVSSRISSTLGTGAVGLTRRCSGLASLAAELHSLGIARDRLARAGRVRLRSGCSPRTRPLTTSWQSRRAPRTPPGFRASPHRVTSSPVCTVNRACQVPPLQTCSGVAVRHRQAHRLSRGRDLTPQARTTRAS